jgi:hypothetical protein
MSNGSYMPGSRSNQPPKPFERLEKWIWIAIYAGFFLIILGIATGRIDETMGWVLAVPGAVLAVTGIVLIYVRSRLTEKKP